MATSRAAQTRATTNYIRRHTRRFTLQCHNEYDADMHFARMVTRW